MYKSTRVKVSHILIWLLMFLQFYKSGLLVKRNSVCILTLKKQQQQVVVPAQWQRGDWISIISFPSVEVDFVAEGGFRLIDTRFRKFWWISWISLISWISIFRPTPRHGPTLSQIVDPPLLWNRLKSHFYDRMCHVVSPVFYSRMLCHISHIHAKTMTVKTLRILSKARTLLCSNTSTCSVLSNTVV